MKYTTATLLLIVTLILGGKTTSSAANLTFVGSHANIGGTFFPGGGLPYVTVPWRTSSANNVFAIDQTFPNQFYGRDGYSLFATTFSYPNANTICCDANINPIQGDELFPNVIDLPAWIEDSQPLATRMAGGFTYALVDDPVLMNNGIRHWTFDGVNYPPAAPGNNTGQNPWVKIGFLDGGDIFGNNSVEAPTARWGFTVGEDVPAGFRIGVMTGGGDNSNFAPSEVFLQQFDGMTPIGDPIGTGTLTGELRDRFVDMHFFDIRNAQAGDTFVIGVMAGEGSFGNSGVAGFSFDVLPEIVGNADFNEDGFVDGSDFLIWQRGLGSTDAGLGDGDATGDGTVNGTDLQVWETQFGFGPSLATSAQVPEPSGLLLVAMGMAAFCSTRRR